VRWENEWLFDGKLCQKYFTKNYQNLMIGFQVTVENVEDTFLRYSVLLQLGYNYNNYNYYEAYYYYTYHFY